MRSADPNRQSEARFARRRGPGLLLLALCLMAAAGSPSPAQSGRKQPEPRAEPPAPGGPQPAQAEPKGREPAAAFIVVTAFPDDSQLASAYHGYTSSQSLEYHARGGCVVELKNIPGARVVEDEDVSRWEAREAALAEDTAWVIWMELRWQEAGPLDPSPFRLRYLLFEPGTGKMVASGYGKAFRPTWGGPQPRRLTLEEQVREAGRDIAAQVVSELTKAATREKP